MAQSRNIDPYSLSVAALIVTYNPDHRLLDGLTNLTSLVDYVVVVDNGSIRTNVIDRVKDVVPVNKWFIIKLGQNFGIAYALNRGIEHIIANTNCGYVLTLDQDTIILLEDIKKVIIKVNSNYKDVGIIALTEKAGLKLPEFSEIAFPITSGNIVKMDVFDKIEYRDDFFIDGVDFDFDYEVRKFGYSIVKYNFHSIDHRLGIKKNGLLYEPDYRIYYIIRNSTVLLIEKKINLKMYTFQAFMWIMFSILNGKLYHSIVALISGFIDGINHNLGKNSTFYPK